MGIGIRDRGRVELPSFAPFWCNGCITKLTFNSVRWGQNILRCPRIRPFDGKARFSYLRWIGRGDAGELRSDVVDDVEVAVRPVVVSQANVGANGLRVRSIQLNEAGKRQESVEGDIDKECRCELDVGEDPVSRNRRVCDVGDI